MEGPAVEGHLCVQRSVDVPPVAIPAPTVDDVKVMEVPGELKPRWRPFGSSEYSSPTYTLIVTVGNWAFN